jgi:branched-chain amino acid transport system substrate-binding protein
MKRTSWLVAGFVAALSFAGKGMSQDTIKIAVGGPHTGSYAAFGEQEWKGAQKAAEDINAKGGVMGKKIEVVKADDACEPKQAVAVANKMVDQEKVVAVVGHFCSSSTIPASEVYDEAGILNITPASTNPEVTERGMKNIFRMCGRDDQQGTVAADFIVQKLKASKPAIIHDKDTYGKGLADSTKNRLKQLGVTEVLYEGLTRGEKDFNALVTKIKSVKADVVYFGGLHAEAGLLINQMKSQGVNVPFISGDGIVSEDFVTSAGGKKYVAGVYVTFGSDPRKIPASKEVVEAFKKTGYEPEGYTLYSYSAVQAVAQAIEGTKSTKGSDLSAWLKKNGAKTVMGQKNWDSKGDLKTADYVMYQWDNNGKYHQL